MRQASCGKPCWMVLLEGRRFAFGQFGFLRFPRVAGLGLLRSHIVVSLLPLLWWPLGGRPRIAAWRQPSFSSTPSGVAFLPAFVGLSLMGGSFFGRSFLLLLGLLVLLFLGHVGRLGGLRV